MKIYIRIFITAISIFVVISSCDRGNNVDKKDQGDWLYYGVSEKLTGVDPLNDISSVSSMISDILFNGLLSIKGNGEIVPDLAKGWERSKDGKRITIHLKEGVKFHDGSLLDANDVDFTLLKKSKDLLGIIEKMKVIENLTISFDLKENPNYFIFNLGTSILPRHVYENPGKNREEIFRHPVGTGPFKVKYLSESEAVLEANREYFKGRPFLDGVVIKSYKSLDEVWSRLLLEEIDNCLPLSPGQVDFMKNNVNFKIYPYLSPYYFLLVYNQLNPLFKNKEIRIALNYALNRNLIIQKVLSNYGRLCSGPIYPESWAYNSEIEPYPYDPGLALKILGKIGWGMENGILKKNGQPFRFSVLVPEGDNLIGNIMLMIEKNLSEIGIGINIYPVPPMDLDEKYLFPKKFDAALLNFDSGINPGILNYRIWHSSQIKTGLNVFSYKNQEVDKDLELGLQALDRKDEKKYYDKFQREIFDDPPGVFLFWKEEMVPIHKRFRGINIGPEKFFASIPEWWVPKNEQKYKNGPQ
ncbi:MAG: ABC transporter substrate-binding protein [bacterium]|nr:ABC transporter substrate-binding protein [bacterium]